MEKRWNGRTAGKTQSPKRENGRTVKRWKTPQILKVGIAERGVMAEKPPNS